MGVGLYRLLSWSCEEGDCSEIISARRGENGLIELLALRGDGGGGISEITSARRGEKDFVKLEGVLVVVYVVDWEGEKLVVGELCGDVTSM